MNYFELNTSNIKEYLFTLDLFKDVKEIEVKDISNGINSVFLIAFVNNKLKPLVLKQALPFFREHRDENISQNRIEVESNAMDIFSEHTPSMIPKKYYSCYKMKLIIIEYIENCIPLATGFLNKIIYPNLSKDIANFLSTSFFKTSSLFLDSIEKRELITSFNKNSQLCQLTENYVFSNRFSSSSKIKNKNKFIHELNYSDRELQKSILELKYKFMTSSDSLIHGDFKPGCILLNREKTFIIDYEFAFVGPHGYDLSSFLYSLIAAIVSFSLYEKESFYINWLIQTVEDTYFLFEQELKKQWVSSIDSALIFSSTIEQLVFEEYQDILIKEIIQNSIGFCAVQISANIIPLLPFNEYFYKQNEFYYNKIMYQISKVFLKKYKTINNVESIIKIIKSLI